MPIDFETLKPQQGKGMTPRRASRETGPNPFLDEGWLMESYNAFLQDPATADREFGPVQGAWDEEGVITRGERAGEALDRPRMTGDAHTVEIMLRNAANRLNIGVSIEFEPGRRRNTFLVKYVGKPRKARRTKEEIDADTEADDE